MTTANDQPRPALRLAEQFAGPLGQSRDDLFHLSNLHPDFVRECFAAIDAKKERLHGPVMGELFPHLVAQGLKLESQDRRMLAAAWLALYGYICIVDYQMDQTGHLSGRSSLAASALLGWGIATLGRYANDTPYASIFLDNINRAFAGQYQDIMVRGRDGADREDSDADKNRALVAAIAGYCAAAGESDDRLIRSSEAMLRPLQIFDDFQDVQEDHEEGNITAFVHIVRECIAKAAPVTQTDMYRVLIKDARTTDVLARASAGIEQALLFMDAERDQVIIAYLCELRDSNAALISALNDYQRDPPLITEPEVMRRIEQIATGC